ncbi:SUN domain-containing ossification factor isoform X2 [Melanotaenia boesemani]|uniref:SUN domain-containing ossification factor isoform X2 n=1 Tax=Melanotaenia boesemani TaxID=1250792 RepID=UPI001C04FE0B|nr:SUN domain-containing ossification factor isoform X2 [Melanotaenia boesemani]
MKRLRVLLVCLIVALLCWYPSQHVYCSEQSLSGSGQSGQDRDPDRHEHEKDSAQNKVVEEWPTGTSYDMGLETERAAQEKLASKHHKLTVNLLETVVEETKPDPESDTVPVAPEPEPTSETQTDLDLQTRTQDHDQEAPVSPTSESVPVQDRVSTEAAATAETSGETLAAYPSLDSHPATTPDEAETIPTSQSAGPTHPGAVRVASAGDELPVDSFVFAEHSDSQCRVIPPQLPICDNSPFGFPVLSVIESDTEDQASSQSHSTDPNAEGQSTSGLVDWKQQQEQELVDGLSSLEQESNTSQHHEQQMGETNTARETDPSVPSKEDIPTFDEWKKQVMEVEKEKSQTLHTSTTGCPHPVKKVQKNFKNNYASVECGAKILSANNEAKSTSAILMENMDLYMLNPCSNKIWFVIELCEPIQVKQLDIANFELFSSTPKDFLVSISDRYPTNKWVKLGTFHARDERIVQSFPLDEQLYAKYVKVELLSHFGSEHFCPLSLIRVFGTSMVEEYEEIADSQYPSERLEYLDEDYDYPPGYQPPEDKASKNLLGSATNAILNMVNNIAANVLGGKPELEGGAEPGGNTTAEGGENKGSTDVTEKPAEAPHEVEEPAKPEQLPTEEPSNVSSDSTISPPSSSESHEDRQIVTLVEEEEEDEEPKLSTVTLLEEEGEEEEEKSEEKRRREADRNQWESQTYCPFSSFSSLSLSCMATLPELLHRWCSSRLSKERLRSLKRKQLSTQTHTRSDESTSVLTHTPPLLPVPVPTPPQQSLPLTEKVIEPEVAVKGLSEGKPSGEVLTTDRHLNMHTPDTHTPELNILLEPSRTSTIPPHSFSDIHSSLTRPTPTHDEKPLPLVKDADLDHGPTPPLQTASIPETQQASSATSTLTVSSTPQPLSSEMASSGLVVPSVKEQPVQSLPTASRPEDLIPPPTELPAAFPPADTHTETVRSGTDTAGDTQRQNVQAPQIHGEQGESPSQIEEPRRVEDTVEEDLLSTNGNGNIHRTATDFYAELQNGGDYNGGAMNGNGGLSNGGAVHGSSQKESVFMRLNNRIKALEMNMSLSSRYLEELSQRYRKQMEEMQRAFNKTIIKLQNTSRIAEEQDQKQTDSIQVLQSQLENVTKLMLNLTATVSQLQREVSDRQSYLVVSLVLCLLLGLLLCLQCCRSSSPSPSSNIAAIPKSNHYPSPKRCFSSYDDMSLKRRVACPLVRSKSFQLSSTEVGPDDLYIVEPLRFSPEKKKKRCKSKSLDKVETLKAFDPSALLANGDPKCNGFLPSLPAPPPLPLPPPPPPLPPLLPSTEEVSSLHSCTPKEFPSETSSCSSSTHSEESYTSRLPPPSPICPLTGMCNGHALSFPLSQLPAKSRQEKRSTKRRKSRQTELQFPHMPGGSVSPLPSLQQLMKGNKEISVGTIGVTAVNGHI